MALHQPNLHSCGVQTPEAININKRSELLRGIVGLDGLGLDDDGGVAFLPCFRTGCDRAGDVAGREDDGSEGHQEDGEDSGDGASDSEDSGDGRGAVSDSIRHNGRCFFHRC